MGDTVICPFWRPYRAHFGVKLVDGVPLCDNLVNRGYKLDDKGIYIRTSLDNVGVVPHCVAFHLYPDDPYSYPTVEDYMRAEGSCRHFVRSDMYSYVMPPFPKKPIECLFGGGRCFHPDVAGFGFCSGCRRFGFEEYYDTL